MVTITMLVLFAFLLVAALSAIMPMYSYALTLDTPVDCAIGQECFIQNYVDIDRSDQYHDYRCGPLSYDGHKGTDFRLKNLVQMREGVDVLAAADGEVVNVRDGMDDITFRNLPADALTNRECGNGVLLKHKGGYQTQYCHLMKGSVAVAPQDTVKRGDVLGKIGISGMSEFPHLHLEVRDRDGRIMDPFSGLAENAICDDKADTKSLWRTDIQPQMAYIPTGILSVGFSSSIPNAEGVRDGQFTESTLASDARSMIFWADLFGLRKGDVLDLRLVGPDNVVMVHHDQVIDGNKAQFFQFIGKHLREPMWAGGSYRARVKLSRQMNGEMQPVLEHEATLDMPLPEVSKEDFIRQLEE